MDDEDLIDWSLIAVAIFFLAVTVALMVLFDVWF